MTRTVVVTIATQSQAIATSKQSGGLIITLINAATGATAIPPQTIPPAAAPGSTYAATFPLVDAGTYTATYQNRDVDGNPVGALGTSDPFAVADVVVVPPATQAYDVPVSVTIAVQ